jgi:hypothetical protein
MMNQIQWQGELSHHKTQAFERLAIVRVNQDAGMDRVLDDFAAEIVRQAQRLVELPAHQNATPAPAPAEARVAVAWDISSAKLHEEIFGMDARIELFDATGRPLPFAVFLIISLHFRHRELPPVETPARTAELSAFSASLTQRITQAWDQRPKAGKLGQLALRVFMGTGWDLRIAPVSPTAGEAISFKDCDAMESYFSASAPR